MMRQIILLFLALICGSGHAQNGQLKSLLVDYDAHYSEKTHQENRHILREVIRQCEKAKDQICIGNALRRMGIHFSEEGRLDSAMACFVEALEIYEGLEYQEGITSTLNSLSALYYQMGQYTKALHSYLETGELAEELSNTDSSYSILTKAAYTNAAQMYYLLDSLEAAVQLLDKVVQIQNEYDNPQDGYVLNLKALFLLDQGAYREALRLFSEAKDQFLLFGNRIGASQCMHNEALCYNGLKQSEMAESYFLMSLDSAIALNNANLIQDIATDFEAFYLEQGDSLRAYHYSGLASRFRDTLLNEAGINALIETEQKYANESKTRAIKIQKERLQQRFYFIVALGIALVLVLGLLLLFRTATRQKQKLVEAQLREQSLKIDELFRKQELNSLNAQMTGQNEERQRISRELHDRLGSLLSTIKLQFSHYEGKLSALESEFKSSYSGMLGMLDNAYDEVRRISHDLSSGVLEKFGLKSAIDELHRAIMEVSTLQVRFIDNKTKPELYHHLDEPLYRIIQELLSNTLKHAQATEVSIQFQINDGIFYFTYEDDGLGMDRSEGGKLAGIGLQNIENRVTLMQGTLSIDSSPGHGMTAMIEIPL